MLAERLGDPAAECDELASMEEADWMERRLRHEKLRAEISALEKLERRCDETARRAFLLNCAVLLLTGLALASVLISPLSILGMSPLLLLLGTFVQAGSKGTVAALGGGAAKSREP